MNTGMLLMFFVAAIFLQQNATVYGFNQNEMIAGSPTPDGMFEFIPRLNSFIQGHGLKQEHDGKNRTLFSNTCTSTIISKRHILTAAQCVNFAIFENENDTSAWNLRAAAVSVLHRGNHTLPLGLKDVAIQPRYYFHPSYDTFTVGKYDIAILEFPDDTDFGITPITLASDYVENEGDMAIVAGYGVHKWLNVTITSEYAKMLQNATVPVYSNCSDIPSTMLCTAKIDVHLLLGDVGGPLMLERNEKYYQVGIVSGNNAKNISYPYGVYTRVSLHCDWISKITKGAAECQSLPPLDPKSPTLPPGPVARKTTAATKLPLKTTIKALPARKTTKSVPSNSTSRTTKLATPTLPQSTSQPESNSSTTTTSSSPSTSQSSSSSQPSTPQSATSQPSSQPSTAAKEKSTTTTTTIASVQNTDATDSLLHNPTDDPTATTDEKPKSSSINITFNIFFILSSILFFA